MHQKQMNKNQFSKDEYVWFGCNKNSIGCIKDATGCIKDANGWIKEATGLKQRPNGCIKAAIDCSRGDLFHQIRNSMHNFAIGCSKDVLFFQEVVTHFI